MLKTAYQQLLQVDPEKPGPSIGPYPQYDEAVRKSLESMAFDGTSPDEAIAQAQEAIQEALTSTSRTTLPTSKHRLAKAAARR